MFPTLSVNSQLTLHDGHPIRNGPPVRTVPDQGPVKVFALVRHRTTSGRFAEGIRQVCLVLKVAGAQALVTQLRLTVVGQPQPSIASISYCSASSAPDFCGRRIPDQRAAALCQRQVVWIAVSAWTKAGLIACQLY